MNLYFLHCFHIFNHWHSMCNIKLLNLFFGLFDGDWYVIVLNNLSHRNTNVSLSSHVLGVYLVDDEEIFVFMIIVIFLNHRRAHRLIKRIYFTCKKHCSFRNVLEIRNTVLNIFFITFKFFNFLNWYFFFEDFFGLFWLKR